jgi:hypothetical protein
VWAAGSWAFGPISAEGTCAGQAWSDNAIATVDAGYQVIGARTPTDCID